MTCIVAYANGLGKVWMGGDSAGVAGHSLVQRADEKVFRNGDFLFGFTSSFRMGQILRYRFKPPRRHPNDDVVEFMSTAFVDDVRACLKEYAFSTVREGVERGGMFLVGFEGRIFKVEEDFQVGISVHPFDACGCGDDIALGAMLSLINANAGMAGEQLVKSALMAAETFSSGVRGPFLVIESKAPGKAEK